MFFFSKSKRTRKTRSPFAGKVRLAIEQLESRLVPYSVSGNAWTHPELITLSFVPDGTIVGSDAGGYIYSNLFATMNARFGAPSAWQNQILRAAQVWAQQTNINFAVVADNGVPLGQGLYQQGDPGMGDIRISGYNFGTTTLAQAFAPPPANNYSIAGDFQLNTGQAWNINATYDLFTVAAHEIGHVLGLLHSGTATTVMYPSYNGVKSYLRADDINGIRDIYSNNLARSKDLYDAVVANDSFTTATSLTALVNPLTKTALVTGLDITTTFTPPSTTVADVDYYSVVAPLDTSSKLTVKVQSTGLSLLAPTLTVYAADRITILATASGAGQYGTTLTATVNGVSPLQQFYIKVAGADNTALGAGQYALTLNFGTGSSPTVPLPNTQTLNGNPISGGGGIPTEFGEEFRVNTTTAGVQQTGTQAVAADANGDFVVTWSSQGQDGSGWGIYARIYNAAGEAVGSEFRVNTTTVGNQQYASVAMNDDGDFVITWSSQGQDGSGWGVYARRYNLAGEAQGNEFRVNTTTAGDQRDSMVAMDAAGNMVFAWSSYATDGDGWGVYARRYNAAGVAQEDEFLVNTVTANDQKDARVAMDVSGNFIVTWSSNTQDGDGWDIYAQRYDAVGVVMGSTFRVNTTTAGNQQHSSVAMDANGDIVIAWSSQASDGSGWNVHAQRYDAAGVAQGGEFLVNTTTANDQQDVTLAMDMDGNFVITWSSQTLAGVPVLIPGADGDNAVPDVFGWGVFAQWYRADGEAMGGEFQVNTSIIGDQRYSSVAADETGGFVVVWSGSSLDDSSGVFGQRYVSNAVSGLIGAEGDSFSEEPHDHDHDDNPPRQQAVAELGGETSEGAAGQDNFAALSVVLGAFDEGPTSAGTVRHTESSDDLTAPHNLEGALPRQAVDAYFADGWKTNAADAEGEGTLAAQDRALDATDLAAALGTL